MPAPDRDLVELTRRSMEQTNERDFASAIAAFAEDAAFDVSAAGLGRFEGREAIRTYLEEWVGAYERQTYSSWDGTYLGGGVVFVIAQFEALPAGSDASVRERWAFTVRWRSGAIVEVTANQDVEAARAAALELAVGAGGGGMSETDVEIVRRSLQTWRRTGEPAWELITEDIEVHDHDIMDAGEYRGRGGVERWLSDWEAAWSDFGMQAEEFIDAGEHAVLVFVRMSATGRESKVRVEREDAILYALSGGLISRIDYFNDRAQALAAAGTSS